MKWRIPIGLDLFKPVQVRVSVSIHPALSQVLFSFAFPPGYRTLGVRQPRIGGMCCMDEILRHQKDGCNRK